MLIDSLFELAEVWAESVIPQESYDEEDVLQYICMFLKVLFEEICDPANRHQKNKSRWLKSLLSRVHGIGKSLRAEARIATPTNCTFAAYRYNVVPLVCRSTHGTGICRCNAGLYLFTCLSQLVSLNTELMETKATARAVAESESSNCAAVNVETFSDTKEMANTKGGMIEVAGEVAGPYLPALEEGESELNYAQRVDTATILIQRRWRGDITRTRVQGIKSHAAIGAQESRAAAAMKIQCRARGQLGRRNIHATRNALHFTNTMNAARRIQSAYRGHYTRHRLQNDEAEPNPTQGSENESHAEPSIVQHQDQKGQPEFELLLEPGPELETSRDKRTLEPEATEEPQDVPQATSDSRAKTGPDVEPQVVVSDVLRDLQRDHTAIMIQKWYRGARARANTAQLRTQRSAEAANSRAAQEEPQETAQKRESVPETETHPPRQPESQKETAPARWNYFATENIKRPAPTVTHSASTSNIAEPVPTSARQSAPASFNNTDPRIKCVTLTAHDVRAALAQGLITGNNTVKGTCRGFEGIPVGSTITGMDGSSIDQVRQLRRKLSRAQSVDEVTFELRLPEPVGPRFNCVFRGGWGGCSWSSGGIIHSAASEDKAQRPPSSNPYFHRGTAAFVECMQATGARDGKDGVCSGSWDDGGDDTTATAAEATVAAAACLDTSTSATARLSSGRDTRGKQANKRTHESLFSEVDGGRRGKSTDLCLCVFSV